MRRRGRGGARGGGRRRPHCYERDSAQHGGTETRGNTRGFNHPQKPGGKHGQRSSFKSPVIGQSPRTPRPRLTCTFLDTKTCSTQLTSTPPISHPFAPRNGRPTAAPHTTMKTQSRPHCSSIARTTNHRPPGHTRSGKKGYRRPQGVAKPVGGHTPPRTGQPGNVDAVGTHHGARGPSVGRSLW